MQRLVIEWERMRKVGKSEEGKRKHDQEGEYNKPLAGIQGLG
jgi:hypothetical protein